MTILETRKLNNEGIKYLSSQFDSDKDRKLIREKFNNVSGKTGKYFVPSILYQNRTARKSRMLIPFRHVIDSGLSFDDLDTVENGVVVEFTNNIFFEQLELEKEGKAEEIFSVLKGKLGSDDNVSAIICLRSTGVSSSSEQRKALVNLKKYLKNNNITEEEALLKRKTPYNNQGNANWEGFIYYDVKGGQQNSYHSHENYIKRNSENGKKILVNLFNPSIEYANEEVSQDITLVLIAFAMFAIPLKKRDNEWVLLVNKIFKNLSEKVYEGHSLKSYVLNHYSIVFGRKTMGIESIELFDPIRVKKIKIEYFAISDDSKNSIDLTHEIAVNKNNYIVDEARGLLSVARPNNLFWSTHLSNMIQQDYSLDEFFEEEEKRCIARKKYFPLRIS